MSARRRPLFAPLHRRLAAEIERPFALATFSLFCDLEPAFARFRAPSALVDHLADKDAPKEERNALLGVLVTASRDGDAVGSLARALVWLALWPGLSSLYAEQRRFVQDDDEVASRIALHFSEQLARIEPSRTTNLIATLLLDTKRSLVEERQREARDALSLVDADFDAADVAADVDVATLRLDLDATAGTDADLVLAHHVARTPIADIARSAGISEDAVRKRISRAVARLRSDVDA